MPRRYAVLVTGEKQIVSYGTGPADEELHPAGETGAEPARADDARASEGTRASEGPPVETAPSPPRENMLPRRGRRRLGVERILVRLISTLGIVGIGVLLGAILVASKVQGWITGLVVAGVTVILSALLWSSRQL